MPVVFIPQEGEQYGFYEWRFCFSILFPPSGDLNTFFLKLDIVCGFGPELARERIHTTPYLFSLLWKGLSFFQSKLNSLALEE